MIILIIPIPIALGCLIIYPGHPNGHPTTCMVLTAGLVKFMCLYSYTQLTLAVKTFWRKILYYKYYSFRKCYLPQWHNKWQLDPDQCYQLNCPCLLYFLQLIVNEGVHTEMSYVHNCCWIVSIAKNKYTCTCNTKNKMEFP